MARYTRNRIWGFPPVQTFGIKSTKEFVPFLFSDGVGPHDPRSRFDPVTHLRFSTPADAELQARELEEVEAMFLEDRKGRGRGRGRARVKR